MINLDKYKSVGTYWIAFLWMAMMQHTLTALKKGIFYRKLKNDRQQKYHNKSL